MHFFKVNK